MKTKQLLIALALSGTFATSINAQSTAVPNGSFENWGSFTIENPQNYPWSTNQNAVSRGLPFNVTKTTDAYHGSFALKLETEIANGDTLPGILINTNPGKDNPATWHGGFAYSQKPSGMRGYYKSAIATPDTGVIAVFFYKTGALIGQYGYYLYGTHNTYTPFSFNFTPALSQNPDTMVVAFCSSNFANSNNFRNGSMLMLDSLSFTGVTSQPALFNGDFESWQSTTYDTPNNWFLQEGGDINVTGGAFKTTDAKTGNFAIELITYAGQHNSTIGANGGRISTGWYPRNCNGNCTEQGGYPFTNQKDTLAFWYKYVPANNGLGQLNINFKKNGNNIWGTGMSIYPSANYQYIELPFDIGQNPDSVIVDIQSSRWEDSLLAFVGSDLKIDDIHFKSDLTLGIFDHLFENNISVYPNPANDVVRIKTSGFYIQRLEIYNLVGEKILTTTNVKQQTTNEVDLSCFQKGIYFVKIYDGQKFYSERIIKQ